MLNFNKKFDHDKKFYGPHFFQQVEINSHEQSLSVINEEQESSVLE